MANILRIFLVLISCWQLSAYAADETPQTLDELKAAIEKVRVETGLPGLGIALVDKNGPYWVSGLGQASLETKIPATENTLFRIGSTSKMFAALSVLKLVEEGKLNLDDKLSDLAPEIYFENPWEKTNPILLVHLLEHTTGWDDTSFPVYNRQDANITLKEALDFHPQYRKSRWVPGTRYAYNNAGPAVAAYIVKKVTGKIYEDYVQAQFFNPLQMTSTTFFETELFKQRGATLYSYDGKALPYGHIILRPAGAINSTATDMANYLQFLITRGSFDQHQLISEDSFSRMEMPTTTLGAKAGTRSGYGLNNLVNGYENAGFAFRGHDGDVSGGHCRLSYIPELQAGYALMINQDNFQALDKIPKLIRAFLLQDAHKSKPKVIPLPKKFQQLAGYYIPLNTRSKLERFPAEIFGVMHFTVKGDHVHREPLLGGWDHPSDDFATTDNTLTNNWHGLPNIAIVRDPLAGEALEVSDAGDGSLFKKVSGIRVFGLLGWIGLTVCLSILSIFFSLIWVVRLARGKIAKHASISIRTWPLATTLILAVGMFAPNIFQQGLDGLSEVSLTTVTIFISSIAFPFFAIYSLFNLYLHRYADVNRIVYWYSVVLSGLHLGLAICLFYYGQFALRLWV